MMHDLLFTKHVTKWRNRGRHQLAGSAPAMSKRAISLVTVTALAASVGVAVGVTQLTTASPAAAAVRPAAVGQPLDCPSDTSLYVIDTTGAGAAATAHLYQVNIATGASTITFSKVLPATTTGAASSANQLGINVTGTDAYYITANDSASGGTGTLWDYTNATGVSTAVAQVPAFGQAGAVNPANGNYYFAVTSASKTVYEYTPGASAVVAVGTWPASIASGSGDLTFDKAGNGYLLNGGTLNRFATPTGPGTATIPVTQLATGIDTAADGVAVGGDGYLYVTANGTSTIQKFNPTTGAPSGSITMTGSTSTSITDAASCSYSSTLAVNKVLPDGRVNTGDQFTLSMSGGGIPASTAVTTSGTGTTATGMAGPVFVLPGTTYTVSEAPAGTTVAANYIAKWSCIDTANGNAAIASGTGTTGTFTYPAPTGSGRAVVCTFTNTKGVILSTSKTLTSVNGVPATANQVVHSGDKLVYTITTTNSGGQPGSTVLTETVPAGTTYSGANEGWAFPSAGTATQAINVAAGGSTPVTFTVTVNSPVPAGQKSITNVVTSSVGSCLTCTVTNPLGGTLTVSKQIGARVDPADQFTVSLSSNGSVLTSATTAGAATSATSAKVPVTVGQTYTVTDAVAAGSVSPLSSYNATIACQDTSSGTPLGTSGTGPTWTVTVPGADNYTITVTNTGQLAYTAAAPASFTDDLSKVLDDATYNADAKATSGTTAYSTANVLSWSGPLALGQVVTVTYSVLVDSPDNGDLQLVNAVVTPPGGNCLTGSTLTGCKTTVSDVVPAAATVSNGGLAFTGVSAGTQLGFALLAFLVGFGLLLLARRRRDSARRS